MEKEQSGNCDASHFSSLSSSTRNSRGVWSRALARRLSRAALKLGPRSEAPWKEGNEIRYRLLVVVAVYIVLVFVAAAAVLSAMCLLLLSPRLHGAECRVFAAIFVPLKVHPSGHVNAPIRPPVADFLVLEET